MIPKINMCKPSVLELAWDAGWSPDPFMEYDDETLAEESERYSKHEIRQNELASKYLAERKQLP